MSEAWSEKLLNREPTNKTQADVDAMIGTALRALQKRIFKIEEVTLGMGSPRYLRSPRSGSRSPGSGEGSPQGPGGVDTGRESEAR